MALQAYWTHGTVGISHVFPSTIELGGLSFTGPALGGEGNIFFPLPTPVVINGNRARLVRVFVLYELHASTSIGPITVLDGQNNPGEFDPQSTGQNAFNFLIPGPVNHTGVDGLNDLIANRTKFEFAPHHPQVFFGLALSVTVRFGLQGKVRFTAVGADYDV
jgi:hypothetical protein